MGGVMSETSPRVAGIGGQWSAVCPEAACEPVRVGGKTCMSFGVCVRCECLTSVWYDVASRLCVTPDSGSAASRAPRRKPHSISLKSAQMRAKSRKIFWCTARLPSATALLRKNRFTRGKVRSRDSDFFLRFRPVGRSFHVLVKQDHDRTGRVTLVDVEKMRDKVPWDLR